MVETLQGRSLGAIMRVTFIHEHDTQRKSRYSELMPGEILRTLYLPTDALRQEFGRIPKRLTVTIGDTDNPEESGHA